MINIILKTKSNVDFIINIVSEFNKIYMNLNNFYSISSLIFFYKKFEILYFSLYFFMSLNY